MHSWEHIQQPHPFCPQDGVKLTLIHHNNDLGSAADVIVRVTTPRVQCRAPLNGKHVCNRSRGHDGAHEWAGDNEHMADTAEIKVPQQALVEFVAELVRRQRIAELEQASTATLLGTVRP